MRTRTVRLSDRLPEFKRHFKGFEVSRLRILSTRDVLFTFICRTCGRHYKERCSMFDLPNYSYVCEHMSELAGEKAVRSDKCDAWVQAARRVHNTLIAENHRNKDKDLRMFNFHTFINFFFDLCRIRSADKVDPTTIRLAQQSHGLIIDNIVFSEDRYKVWPSMRKIALHYKMQGK